MSKYTTIQLKKELKEELNSIRREKGLTTYSELLKYFIRLSNSMNIKMMK
jgi:metal-responsive CopG/Arc/MetJ family transcriptional regulator